MNGQVWAIGAFVHSLLFLWTGHVEQRVNCDRIHSFHGVFLLCDVSSKWQVDNVRVWVICCFFFRPTDINNQIKEVIHDTGVVL